MGEDQLLLRMQEQDITALDECVDRYIRLVSALISGAGEGQLTQQDVEELASDTFIAVWDSAGNIRPGGLKAYICTVARNKAYDRLRSMDKDTPVSLDDMADDLCVPDGVEEREAAQIISDSLDELDDDDRRMIILRYYYCRNSSEIGRLMDMSPETVRTRLARARKKLKKILTERGLSP